MIGINFFAKKMRTIFLKTIQKFSPEIPYLCQEIHKIPIWFHSVMTSKMLLLQIKICLT